MQRLAYRRIIDPEIARHRVDLPALASANPVDGPLDLIEQGDHITGIVRIAGWYPGGKDKAGGGFRHEAGFAPKLGRAIALPFEDGSNGQIVGIDEFTVAELLALGQPARLLADLRLGGQGAAQLPGQPLPLNGGERLGLLQELRVRSPEMRHLITEYGIIV